MRILHIDIDTLRKDHMSCYGYGRKTTPNMDEIAHDGVMFSNYYCSDAPCLPARAALISGMFGIHNGAVGHGGTAADRRLVGQSRSFRDVVDMNNFTNIFRKAGLHTASISTFAERHSSWWFNAGFKETYNVGSGGMESGEQVLPVGLDWVDKNAENDNWYLHFHLWDPHTPYRAPLNYGKPFENEQLPDNWITQDIFNEHLKHTGPHSANEINMYNDDLMPNYPRHPGRLENMDDLKRFMDDYDTGILYADYIIGRLFEALKEKGVFEDVAVIISSDHGENMGELGIYGEHATADQPTCNIPMIIKWPGCKKGLIDKELHYNIDLVPTVADLLNIPLYEGWDGESYSKTMIDGTKCGREYLVVSQLAHVCQRTVRFDDFIYIKTYHCGYHLFPEEMLFDIKNDPHQLHNLAEERKDLNYKGAYLYQKWYDEMMISSNSSIDPLWTVMREGGPSHTLGSLPEYLKRLEKTSRQEGARLLRKKYL